MAEWKFKLLIDGECPLCKREAEFLRCLDRGRQRLFVEDITAPDFDPCKYDTTVNDLMGQIHGVMPDGTLVKGVEVFRIAYETVGLGWLLAPTKWPILKQLSDVCYAWFARNRLRLTGRTGLCNSTHCRVGRS